MREEFDIDSGESSNFNIKGFLFKLLAYWPFFLITIGIGLAVAHYINVRKVPVYTMSNMISIKDDQNPFFTTNTSLTFNWGGSSDRVSTAIIKLKSRSHNEQVVDRMQYYVNYQRQGEYQLIDAYKQTPFLFKVKKDANQILNSSFKIVFKDSATFTISKDFLEGDISVINYKTFEKSKKYITAQNFNVEYKLGQQINTPYINGVFLSYPEIKAVSGAEYFISFSDFDATVKNIAVSVTPEGKGSTILRLRMNGVNKSKLVDYLNTSVQVLSDDLLERKNLFATKTIRFIDSSLQQKSLQLKDVEKELNTFRNNKNVYDLESEGLELKGKLNELDIRKEIRNRELNYYTILEQYLRSRSDYSDVPAPSVAGIQEASITQGVSRIVELAEQRSNLSFTYRDGAPVFDDIDRQINSTKSILLENIINSKGIIEQELSQIKSEISGYESEVRRLPKNQQELLKIERRYTLNQGTYDLFLAKSSEARLVKAANVSDVLVIDSAKDVGAGKIGPNTRLNYMLALVFGFLVPLLYVFIRVFLNDRITNVKEIESLSKIPILGVIGKSTVDNNLAVITKPKSAISESFRAVRSSLQFMYKKHGVEGTKTVLVTSSVSGEGKTFCSINIASVFALSERKTVLIGLDLRKPKIFGDFNIDNDIGVVNYLIGESPISAVIQKTQIANLDIITSGPIPPNPSELLMSEQLEMLIDELKKEYDYIVLDSPPLGLVADSLELLKYADATLYMVRQNYTKKGMLQLINEKYKRGEVKNISYILNFFEDKAKYGYGYGQGYGYGYGYGAYGNGYHEVDEKPSFSKKILKIFKKSNR